MEDFDFPFDFVKAAAEVIKKATRAPASRRQSAGSSYNEDSSGDESDTGSSVSSSSYADSDVEHVAATYPYPNSDSDGEDEAVKSWRFLTSASTEPQEVEAITIPDDDDLRKIDETCEMVCYRCPDSDNTYKQRGLFLLHKERHFGRNHFVCPSCRKPFIKLSYCFAHEIRAHDKSFPIPVQSPVIAEAYAYRQAKEKKRKEKELRNSRKADKNQTDSSSGANPPPSQQNGYHDPDKEAQEENGHTPDPVSSSVDAKSRANSSPPQENGHTSMSNGQLSSSGGNPPQQNIHNSSEPLEFELNSDYESSEEETDEDDPKFYPGHIVPSTSLYPFRGPDLYSPFDSYEVHLKFGRRKRTAANTISRCILAHRQKLITEGRVSGIDNGTFWKPQPPPTKKTVGKSKRKRDTEHIHSDNNPNMITARSRIIQEKNKRKLKSLPSSSSSAIGSTTSKSKSPPPNKKRKLRTQGKTKGVILSRTFISSVICRVCQLCQYTWSSQEDLERHREAKHPKKRLVDLMTKLRKVKKSKKLPSSSESSSSDEDLFTQIEIPKSTTKSVKSGSSSGSTTEIRQDKNSKSSTKSEFKETEEWRQNREKNSQDLPLETFLGALGLVSNEKLEEINRKMKAKHPVKFCIVVAKKMPTKFVPRSGRAFVCGGCDFFAKSRDLVKLHERMEGHQINESKRKKSIASRSPSPKKKMKKDAIINTKDKNSVNKDKCSITKDKGPISDKNLVNKKQALVNGDKDSVTKDKDLVNRDKGKNPKVKDDNKPKPQPKKPQGPQPELPFHRNNLLANFTIPKIKKKAPDNTQKTLPKQQPKNNKKPLESDSKSTSSYKSSSSTTSKNLAQNKKSPLESTLKSIPSTKSSNPWNLAQNKKQQQQPKYKKPPPQLESAKSSSSSSRSLSSTTKNHLEQHGNEDADWDFQKVNYKPIYTPEEDTGSSSNRPSIIILD